MDTESEWSSSREGDTVEEEYILNDLWTKSPCTKDTFFKNCKAKGQFLEEFIRDNSELLNK